VHSVLIEFSGSVGSLEGLTAVRPFSRKLIPFSFCCHPPADNDLLFRLGPRALDVFPSAPYPLVKVVRLPFGPSRSFGHPNFSISLASGPVFLPQLVFLASFQVFSPSPSSIEHGPFRPHEFSVSEPFQTCTFSPSTSRKRNVASRGRSFAIKRPYTLPFSG